MALITLFPVAESEQAAQVSLNHPFKWRDVEFHIGQKIGYSPEIQLIDQNDSTIFRAFMRVAIISEEGREIHRDFVFISDHNLRMGLEVISSGNGGDIYNFPITVHRDDRLLYEGSLNLGDTVEFENHKLVLPRIRNWCYIGVIKSPYLNLVFFGFWSALAGMALGLVSRIISTGRK